jgi:hypothetical protein
MHQLFLEALRHREQEILKYLAILGPALSGYVLLYIKDANTKGFFLGTLGALLALLIGSVYSLYLGYNFRYIVLEIAKIELILGMKDDMLVGWPRHPKQFQTRYVRFGMPYCTPPGIIEAFWLAFIIGMFGITVSATILGPIDWAYKTIIIFLGITCICLSFYLPTRHGKKLHALCEQEMKDAIARKIWGEYSASH